MENSEKQKHKQGGTWKNWPCPDCGHPWRLIYAVFRVAGRVYKGNPIFVRCPICKPFKVEGLSE
jgi:rubrerythrin